MHNELGDGSISHSFKERGAATFFEACQLIRSLSYKRNSTKTDPLIVLKESCGTCSSKHELIKRLAEENEISDCSLVLCMFKMSGENTPKVKPVLDKYGLEYIPEAHTYITINGEIHDLTFPGSPELLYLKDVIFTEYISADQIRSYKESEHKACLREWLKERNVAFTFEEIWGIREECIGVLSV